MNALFLHRSICWVLWCNRSPLWKHEKSMNAIVFDKFVWYIDWLQEEHQFCLYRSSVIMPYVGNHH